MPVIRWLRYLFGSPALIRKRVRAILFTNGVIAVIAAMIFFIPVPLNTLTEGVVWMPEKSNVRAGADGFVETVLVEHGEQVDRDTLLIVTTDPLIQAKYKLLKAQYLELKIKQAALVDIDIVQADITLEEMVHMRGRIDHLEEQIADLDVKSPQDGSFVITGSGEIDGYFVKQGDPVAYVINYDEVSVRVVVPQNAIRLVRKKVEDVEIRFVDNLDQSYHVNISREIPAATYKLPSKALAQQGGGKIQTDPFDADGIKTKDQYFQFEIALPEDVKTSRIGQRVFVKFKHGKETLALQWYRSLEELFLNELGKV